MFFNIWKDANRINHCYTNMDDKYIKNVIKYIKSIIINYVKYYIDFKIVQLKRLLGISKYDPIDIGEMCGISEGIDKNIVNYKNGQNFKIKSTGEDIYFEGLDEAIF